MQYCKIHYILSEFFYKNSTNFSWDANTKRCFWKAANVNKFYWVTLIKADINIPNQNTWSKFFLSVSAFWKQKSMRLTTYFLGYHWAKDTPLWLIKIIFSNDLREQIANNFKKLNNVSGNLPTIHQYLQFFLTRT